MTRRKAEIIRDGLVLRGELDQEGADRPLVILMHGFGGSMGKTDREILPVLNEKLLEAGFQTFRGSAVCRKAPACWENLAHGTFTGRGRGIHAGRTLS